MSKATTAQQQAASAAATTQQPQPSTNVSHGYAFEAAYAQANPTSPIPPQPRVAVQSEELARPGYQSCSASEYLDTPQVLDAKVDFLINMMKNSTCRVAYTGAGISSSCLHDYASKASGSITRSNEASGSRMNLQPTANHRVLSALFKAGYLDWLLDQNHDNLSLKAGVDYSKVCAIHGSWGDRWNRVLMFDDKLRPDLVEMMNGWASQADFCFALGTSLAGMTADTVAEQVALRHKNNSQNRGQGLCILTIQETRMDRHAALKIYARIEDVMAQLKSKLKLKIETKTYDLPHFRPPQRKPAAGASSS